MPLPGTAVKDDVVTPASMSASTTQAAADDEEDVDDFVEDGDLSPARDGGVFKEILVKGKGWQRAEAGDEVSMMYKGTLSNGTVFDSSYDRGSPFTFKLGASSVIKGWDIVAKTMAKGEKARVTLSPEYAYGASGSPPKIPPNATLIFEMELVDFQSKKDVFGDESVIKSEVESGTGWERPSALASVTLNIVATACIGGTTPGNVPSRMSGAQKSVVYEGAQTFTLGANQMPLAWERVVPDMKKKAKLLLVCKEPHLRGAAMDQLKLPTGTTAVEYLLTLDNWVKAEILSPDDSSVIKQVLCEGEGWERPNDGAAVVVNIEYFVGPAAASVTTSKAKPDARVIAAATAAPSKETKTFATAENLTFTLGDGTVVDGLDQAIQNMKAKEVARITLASKMAFESAPGLIPRGGGGGGGGGGSAGLVSASDPIVAVVKLISFEKAKDMWSMSFEEKADEMMSRKLKGNDLFEANRLKLAVKAYERAISLFDSPTSELGGELKQRVNQLLVQCHLNLAACFEQQREVNKVVTHCKKALEIEPGNVKALYRRGSAFIELDDYYSAESDLKYALELDPSRQVVQRKMQWLQRLQARQDAKDRKLYSNLFGRLNALEEKERKKNPHLFKDEDEEGNGASGAEQGDEELDDDVYEDDSVDDDELADEENGSYEDIVEDKDGDLPMRAVESSGDRPEGGNVAA